MLTFPTRGVALLDKFFTNYPNLFTSVKKLAPLGNSDHCCILIQAVMVLPENKHRIIKSRPYRDSSVRSFGRWMVNFDWDHILNGVVCNDQVDVFLSQLTEAYHMYFPEISTIQKKKISPG